MYGEDDCDECLGEIECTCNEVDADLLRDSAIDDRLFCETLEEAIKLHNNYSGLDRYFNKEISEKLADYLKEESKSI